MPTMRHRLRSGYSWRSSLKVSTEYDGPCLTRSALCDHETRLVGGRQLPHLQPQLRIGDRLVAVRRVARGQKPYFLQAQCLLQLERGAQVRVMDGIEGPAEDAHRIHEATLPDS